jgi:C_GCAxxG_C_C family probable redox protein
VQIRPLTQTDLPRVIEMLTAENLPTEDLAETDLNEFLVAEDEGRVVGVGGLEQYGHTGLLRSLAVDQVARGSGIGSRLYEALELQAREKGLLRLYLLTTTAERYFSRMGYAVIERDVAPLPIQKSRQFSSLCPQSAVVMQKPLTDVPGVRVYESGLFCAESVLSAVAKHHAIESDLIPGIATGLCSGMGRTGGTCGALSGGILAINLLHGRKSASDSVDRDYAAVQELVNGFSELFGTTNCTELLGCDLGSEAGQATFKEQQLRRRCREFTSMATDLAITAIEKASKR